MIYHRIKAETEHLKESDYINGFGIDSSLVIAIIKEKRRRGIELPKRDIYDNRTGYAIDMTPFNNTYHEIFQYDLLDTESGKQLQIDGYSEMNWYGKYWVISAMDKDTRSHRSIIWENETCHEPDNINQEKENKIKYKLVKAETPRWNEDGSVNTKNQKNG